MKLDEILVDVIQLFYYKSEMTGEESAWKKKKGADLFSRSVKSGSKIYS